MIEAVCGGLILTLVGLTSLLVVLVCVQKATVRTLLEEARQQAKQSWRERERLMDRLTATYEKAMPPEDTSDYIAVVESMEAPKRHAAPTNGKTFDPRAYLEQAVLDGLSQDEVQQTLARHGYGTNLP